MVGIFSRFSVGRSGLRRTQSSIDERGALPPSTSDLVASINTQTSSTHGIEEVTEFKPVDHPMEPLEDDQPIQCPLPEPSILNEGRIWKERVSSSMRRRGDLAIVQDGMGEESDGSVTKPSGTSQCNPKRLFSPSLSAPEHHLLNILEECKASGSI
ncbi:unnamed protein product [Microthlaspi erraticum]|uniref:Cystic fibrosis transmembrane conductance regulator n=1 Tax=Microthlaspi erraticum TaxID=1685480 RepID=A0A6D2HVU7_9BRAS|nr:unnamed protein product [Microthlaspi erraticum]CAA7024132.1 unnamed protein product [Microthlaspi erraticum]